MKTAIFMVFLCGSLQAANLTNNAGKVFEKVKITHCVPGGINFLHAHGAAYLPYSELSMEDKTVIRNELIRRAQERKDAIVPSIREIHLEYADYQRMLAKFEAKQEEEKQKQIDHEEYEAATMRYFAELRKDNWDRIERNAVVVLNHYRHPVRQKKQEQQQVEEWSSGCNGYVKNTRSVNSTSTFGVPNSDRPLPSASQMYFDAGEGLKLLVAGDLK